MAKVDVIVITSDELYFKGEAMANLKKVLAEHKDLVGRKISLSKYPVIIFSNEKRSQVIINNEARYQDIKCSFLHVARDCEI